jgi:hypothetical protein
VCSAIEALLRFESAAGLTTKTWMVTEAGGVATVVAVMEQIWVVALDGTVSVENTEDGEGLIVQTPEFTVQVTPMLDG